MVPCTEPEWELLGDDNIIGGNIFKMKLEMLVFRDRCDILLEKRPSGAVEQGYTVVYGKSWLI